MFLKKTLVSPVVSPCLSLSQVAKEHLKGDPLMLGTFDQAWGALVRRRETEGSFPRKHNNTVFGRVGRVGAMIGFIYAYVFIYMYVYILVFIFLYIHNCVFTQLVVIEIGLL